MKPPFQSCDMLSSFFRHQQHTHEVAPSQAFTILKCNYKLVITRRCTFVFGRVFVLTNEKLLDSELLFLVALEGEMLHGVSLVCG